LRYHVLSWSLWVLAAALPALMTRNPLYLLLVLLSAALSYAQNRDQAPTSWGVLLKGGLILWALAIPFNALFAHHGDIVLFVLPRNWPLIGGSITLEAMIYGAVSGLALLVILVVFTTYNLQVSHYELLRHTPGFLYQASLVTSIAVTFVPQLLASAQEIREAQTIRGHRFKRPRDMLPLFMPLLTCGMERAVQLAESMESRGFGGNLAPITPRQETIQRLSTLLGLLGLVVGLFLADYFPRHSQPGWIMIGISALLLLGVFRAQGRRVRRTCYRRSAWKREDTAVALASVAVIVTFASVKLLRPQALVYYPYPPFSLMPDFHPLLGAVLLLLALPAILRELGSAGRRSVPRTSGRQPLEEV